MAKSRKESWESRMKVAIEEAAIAALSRTAFDASGLMKAALRETNPPAVFTGRTVDSITYGMIGAKTAQYLAHDVLQPGNPSREPLGPSAKPEDIIQPLTERFVAKVGSAYKVAKYLEKGTGPHRQNTDQDEFIAKMKVWGAAHGLDPHQTYNLINRIRAQGTMRKPFIEPTREVVRERLPVYFSQALKKAIKAMPVPVREQIIELGKKVSFGAE